MRILLLTTVLLSQRHEARSRTRHSGTQHSGTQHSRTQLSRTIVLAEMRRQLLAADPAQLPLSRPRSRIRARVVHGDLVTQRLEARPREALGQMQLARMREPAVREPEI